MKRLLLLFVLSLYHTSAATSKYALYVWTDAFNATAEACDGVYPDYDRSNANACFYHSWDTLYAREHLWASCDISDNQKVHRIFLSGVKAAVENAAAGMTCDETLVTTLQEAHERDIQVYALFAASDAAFSEKDMVGNIKTWNERCSSTAQFDGVAVNNEYFSSIKSCSEPSNLSLQQQLLTDLQTTADNAVPLPLHFSVSWNWDCCSCSEENYERREIEWNGTTKSALEHMIDIADSVDVQVAWNEGSTMAERATRPYTYWVNTKQSDTTAFYVLAYTNPVSDCRLSFSPHVQGSLVNSDTCSTGDRTEAGMFQAFDEIKITLPSAQFGIHYMGGVYSTGMPGWPQKAIPTSPSPTQAPSQTPRDVCSGFLSQFLGWLFRLLHLC